MVRVPNSSGSPGATDPDRSQVVGNAPGAESVEGAGPDAELCGEPGESRSGFPSIKPLLLVAAATLALLSPLFLHHARAVEVDASMDMFFGADQRSKESFEKLESMMTDRVACLVLVRFDGIFSDEGADRIHRMGMALADLEGIPSVFSLTRARRPVRRDGFSLDPRKLIEFQPFLPRDGRTPEEWAQIRASVLDFPWSKDLLVSSDGRWAMLIAEIARELPDHASRVKLRDDVEQALAPFRGEVDELQYGGFPFIEAEVRDDVSQDVLRFLVALPLLLAGVLLFTFRSFQVFLAVLLFEIMGIGFLPVLVNWNGGTLNLYSGILLPLVAGLQLTFLTHFFAALRWGHRSGLSFSGALAAALRHVFKPAAIAALTTIIGLLSLLSCDVPLVREFGLLGAQAVVLAFGVTFLPILLVSRCFCHEGAEHPRLGSSGVIAQGKTRFDAFFDRLQVQLVKRRRVLLGSVLVLLLASLPAIRSLRTDLRAIEFLAPESQARQAMTAIDEQMGGMNLFQLEVDSGHRGGIAELEFLRFLERVEAHARELDGVTNIYGYAQLYAVLNQIWTRDADNSRHVPEDPALIKTMGLVVHGEKFLFGDEIFDQERRRTTLFLRTRDMPAAEYLGLLQDFVSFAEQQAPPGVTLNGKSGIHSVLESDRRIVRSQIKSLLLCGLVVFVTLTLLWRSLRAALVAVLVNLPPLAAILAMHGYGGIPLNSVTVMVGAVVLGIAVDNCIHVLSFWSEERARGVAVGLAARRVVAKKLGAMFCTTAVLVGGLGLFLFSSFPPVADFGRLAMVALGVALIATVLLVPSLVVVIFNGKPLAESPG